LWKRLTHYGSHAPRSIDSSRYQLTVDVGVVDGKRKQLRKRYATEKEARAALDAVRGDVAKGIYVHPSKVTLTEACEDRLAAKHGLKPSTLHGHRLTWQAALAELGDVTRSARAGGVPENTIESDTISQKSGKGSFRCQLKTDNAVGDIFAKSIRVDFRLVWSDRSDEVVDQQGDDLAAPNCGDGQADPAFGRHRSPLVLETPGALLLRQRPD
jgi:Arm DNA-binding domain